MIQIDMEMPSRCDDCPCSYDFRYCTVAGQVINLETSGETRMEFCPLIPVNTEMPKSVMDDFMKKIRDACEKEIPKRVNEHDD